jgi:prepilin-type N-terminal cleavage/methylation domain-containing protein
VCLPKEGPVWGPSGFTLIELLAVLAIIGILAGLLIPTVGVVGTQARRSQSKALFHQLATACVNYKADNGYYPLFGQARGTPDTVVSLETAGEAVYRTLTGYSYDGTSILNSPNQRLNPKGRSYYSFSEQDFTGESVVDAFGNTDIIVILDTDYNHQIARQVLSASGPARHIDGRDEDAFQPVTPNNIRQPILIYSAGAGRGKEVTSWPYEE